VKTKGSSGQISANPESHRQNLKSNMFKFTYLKEPKKRQRTSPEQFATLLSFFESNPNPTPKDRKKLADKTGMTARTVQIWFQNRRAKYRPTANTFSSDSSDSSDSPSSPSDTSSPLSPPSSPLPSSSSSDLDEYEWENSGENEVAEKQAEIDIKDGLPSYATHCSFIKPGNIFPSSCAFEVNHNFNENHLESNFLPHLPMSTGFADICPDDPFVFTQNDFDIITF